MSFTPVEEIIDFQPTQIQVGQDRPLAGTVVPNNATNPTIRWSVVSGNATIVRQGNVDCLRANASGIIKVRATIENGLQQ